MADDSSARPPAPDGTRLPRPAEGMLAGDRLRDARQRRALSLRALAELTGFSASFLSQVELGQSSPSLASLQRIADALGLSVAALLPVEATTTPVVKKSNRTPLHSAWSRATAEALMPGMASGALQAVLIRLQPGGRTGVTAYQAAERVFAYCVSGTPQLILSPPEKRVAIEPGDSLVTQQAGTLAWENPGAVPAELLVVTARVP